MILTRAVRPIALAAAGLLCLGSLPGCSSASQGERAAEDVIRVGLIAPSTGALAQFGADTIKAWKFAARQLNAAGGVAGKKMEIRVYETDGSTARTVQEARQAATKDGVGFLGAVMTGPENQAVNSQLDSLGVLNFNATGNDDNLIAQDCNRNAFRSVTSSSMDLAALAGYVAGMPVKKWAILAEDYSIGHSAAKTFTTDIATAGGQVVQTQFAPLGTHDFGPYIAKLLDSGADGLFAVEYGADAVAFVQQGTQYRLFDGFQQVVGMNLVSEPLFDAIGKSTLGFLANVNYAVDARNRANRAFVKQWTAEFGTRPYYVEANTYLAAQMLIAGVAAAHSADPAKVREALAGLSFDSIAGRVTVRAADHQLLQPSYVGKVVRAGKGFGWKILARVPGSKTSSEPSPKCQL